MILINDLYKKYSASTLETALDIASLQIPTGQSVGLIGENGSGKTTFLRAVSGLLTLRDDLILERLRKRQPQVEIDGLKCGQLQEQIVYITEAFSFFPHLKVKKQPTIYLDFFPNFDSKKYFELLSLFNLPLEKRAGSLSRGQKSKLEIAIGLSKNGKYLFIDEPFLGMDIIDRRNFFTLLAKNMNQEQTLIIATHEIDEIENFIDRAIFLKDGKVIMDLLVDDIRETGNTLDSLYKKQHN